MRLVVVCLILGSVAAPLLAAPPGGTCLYNWKTVSNGNAMQGVSDHVWDLVVAPQGSPLGPAVYACGDFVSADGMQVNHIAKWNGTQWSALGGKSGTGLNADCHALALGPDGSLYAAGLFTIAGGVDVSGIARWDGSAWHALGAGAGTKGFLRENGTEVGNVYGLYFYDGGWGPGVSDNAWLLAGGNFTSASPPPFGLSPQVHNVARWNGTAWYRMGTYPDDGVDGETPWGAPQVSDFLAFDFGSGTSLYLAGSYDEAGPGFANAVARWDGGYSPLGSGLTYLWGAGLGQAIASFQGQVYVGGGFTQAGSTGVHHLARWDGSTWSWAGGPIATDATYIEGLHAANLGNGTLLYMAGFFLQLANPNGSPTTLARHIARFDGQKWMKLGAGLGPDIGNDPHGMVMEHRLETDGNCLYVGGAFETAGAITASNMARWCCKKTPFIPSESINAYPVNAQVPFSFTDDDGDGLPESIACDDDREIPVFPGSETEACGLHFVFGTTRGDELHLETSTLPVVAFGGPGRNTIFGSRFDDLLFGGSDDETLAGGAGDDQIYAGLGDDVLLGDLGDDRLIAGPGDDRLDSGPGINAVDGGDGTDTAFIQPADEQVDLESVTILGGGGSSRTRRR